MADEFDYVIVGSGSAGSAVAKRLSEDGRNTVCVLEAGPADNNPLIHIPAGFIKNIYNPALTWSFTTPPVPGIDNRKMPLVVGKTLGGSSSINGMVYSRGQARDYDGWAQRGNPGWSYEDVLPYFKRAETRDAADADFAYRGRSGPLQVSDSAYENPLFKVFIEAGEEIGQPFVKDYNAARQDGVGSFQFTIDRSGFWTRRMSTARAYLHPARKSGRVDVRTNAYASSILFEGKRAVGIRYQVGSPTGQAATVRARKEVVISCGALNTPRLLQISGIGPADHLRSIGVDVLVDSPGVGANYHDHYQIRIAGRVEGVETINEKSRGGRLAAEVLKYLAGRPSIVGMGPVCMRLFFRSDPALENPDLQISFTPASYKEGEVGVLENFPGVTLGGYKQRPDSRGTVRAVSRDIAVAPEIQPNYLSASTDRQAVVEIVKMARRMLGTKAFARYGYKEEFPGKDVQTDDEILAFAKKYGGTAFHHAGTARMGPDGDSGAVVDPRLRVRGVENLRVVDASIMPVIASGPPNGVVIMIGERGADLILGKTASPA